MIESCVRISDRKIRERRELMDFKSAVMTFMIWQKVNFAKLGINTILNRNLL
jgi:hypothetical protein